MKQNPQLYEWDFDGSCKPDGRVPFSMITFSVGVFQWRPKASGKGLKRGPVAKRIKGYVSDPEDVYRRAQAECDRRNAERFRT